MVETEMASVCACRHPQRQEESDVLTILDYWSSEMRPILSKYMYLDAHSAGAQNLHIAG